MPLPKLVIFDLTDTLVKDNSWVALHEAFGMTPKEDQFLYDLNQEGIITNDLWLQIVNNLYNVRGRATRDRAEQAAENYQFVEGAKECVSLLQECGIEVAILSGSYDLFVNKVAQDLGIRLARCGGTLQFDDSGNFSKLSYIDEELVAKVKNFKSLCAEVGVSSGEVICVGDGSNERELFKLVRGITFQGSNVADVAWEVVPGIKHVANAILQA